jgi:nucleotide-binding universal stress UspA family protein
MFHRVLIPTDFSTASEWAFDHAVRIASANSAELLILHIRMTRSSRPGELRFPADPAIYEFAEQHELDKLRESLKRSNSSVRTRLVVKQAPDPGGEIARTAVEENADLIVMATHARHHVAHLFIGSTTLNVLADPPAPVLMVRYGIPRHDVLKTFVVPVHLKQTDHPSLDLASRMAAESGGEVHLLSVCGDEERSDAEGLVAKLRETSLAGVSSKAAVIHGKDVDREIVRYCDRVGADMLLLNSRPDMGSVKIDVIRQVQTPVMIVPQSAVTSAPRSARQNER